MAFRSNHYILFYALSLIHISHLHTVQGHLSDPLVWNIPHLGSEWRSGRADKKTLQTSNTKTWLPKGSAACQSLINHSFCRCPLPPARPTSSNLSARVVGLKRLVIIPFDLRVWRTSAIRLYYDQGHPGTCLSVWNDVACHWSKWQPDGSVSSTGTHCRHD